MTPKKVWSVILIVVGVLLVFNGITGLAETAFYGNEIESMGKLVNKYGGSVGSEFFNHEQSRQAIQNSKTASVISILLGICGAIWGTLMLKENKESQVDDLYIDEEIPKTTKWRL